MSLGPTPEGVTDLVSEQDKGFFAMKIYVNEYKRVWKSLCPFLLEHQKQSAVDAGTAASASEFIAKASAGNNFVTLKRSCSRF